VCPSESTQPFSPIEAIGVVSQVSAVLLAGVVCKQHLAWIKSARRDEENAVASLGQAGKPGIHETVRPPETQRFKVFNKVRHRRTAIENEHVSDVLKHEPIKSVMLDEPEHVPYEAGLGSTNTCHPARL